MERAGAFQATYSQEGVQVIGVGTVSAGYQNLLICIEMALAAVALRFAFPSALYAALTVGGGEGGGGGGLGSGNHTVSLQSISSNLKETMNPRDIMADAIHNFHPQYQQYTQQGTIPAEDDGFYREYPPRSPSVSPPPALPRPAAAVAHPAVPGGLGRGGVQPSAGGGLGGGEGPAAGGPRAAGIAPPPATGKARKKFTENTNLLLTSDEDLQWVGGERRRRRCTIRAQPSLLVSVLLPFVFSSAEFKSCPSRVLLRW